MHEGRSVEVSGDPRGASDRLGVERGPRGDDSGTPRIFWVGDGIMRECRCSRVPLLDPREEARNEHALGQPGARIRAKQINVIV